MMSEKGKVTGRGDKGGGMNNNKKTERGGSSKERRSGSQGRGGGLGTPPRASRHSTCLNSGILDKDTQAKEEAAAQATNPFHVLQMEEDEELEDEETEEINDMEISPAPTAPRTLQHRPKKRFECEDSSVGSMRCPTKGSKLDIMDANDNAVVQEEKQMEVDVTTTTFLLDEGDMHMREDTNEDTFRYNKKPPQEDSKHLKSYNNPEGRLDSEEVSDDKLPFPVEADKMGIGRKLQEVEDANEASSQSSDELEWDDTMLEENTQGSSTKNGQGNLHDQSEGEETVR